MFPKMFNFVICTCMAGIRQKVCVGARAEMRTKEAFRSAKQISSGKRVKSTKSA